MTVAVMLPEGTEARVCAEIAARAAKGLAKYGTTVQDNPLSLREWLQHQYEELLDAAIYCKRAMEEMDKSAAMDDMGDHFEQIDAQEMEQRLAAGRVQCGMGKGVK